VSCAGFDCRGIPPSAPDRAGGAGLTAGGRGLAGRTAPPVRPRLPRPARPPRRRAARDAAGPPRKDRALV